MKFNRENNYRKQEIEGMQKINSEVLKEVKHTVDGSKNEIVYIDMDKIRPNSRNQYEMTEIEEMAGMIKLAGGILQNLIVKPMDEEGYYVLTTGERRWRGARLLRDRNEYPAIFDNKVPCVIQDPVEIELPLNDEDKENFAILVTNQYRVKTDAILYMEMLQWKRIISNLKKAGVEYLPKEFGSDQEIKLKGKRTRELVAEQMNLSTGQVARFEKIENYWNQTETFEALQWYIDLNFDGLRDDVLQMMAGKKIPVNTGSFTNDMTTFRTEDDVLTLLIHLGYLGYEEQNKYVFIPNAEVQSEYASAVTVSQWGDISKALKNSADLLQAVWEKQETQVAEGIRLAHFETSQLQYNDENALSYTISLALYAARNFYTVYRELPGGKGFADLVFVPRKRYQDKPALVVELKWDKTAEGALAQIKDKEYCRSLEEYQGNLLLVGINYNKKTKEHVCRIEEYQK